MQPCYYLGCLVGILYALFNPAESLDPAHGRYSFSLTTFHPTGKLGQVEWAMEAAAQGTPVFGMIWNSTLILSAPQILPSPFMTDDGTARFSFVTQEIVISHSGIAADGRVLVAEAQKIALQHLYTYNEEIDIDLLLDELSLVFQHYTMKVAARPFGATLLVGHNPARPSSSTKKPCFYRIDPSGAVSELGNVTVLNGDLSRTDAIQRLRELSTMEDANEATGSRGSQTENAVAALLRQTLRDVASKQGSPQDVAVTSHMTILTASLSSGGTFSIRRHSGP